MQQNTSLPNDFYLVESIIGKKKIGRGYRYLVKWENFPLEAASWEPASNLKDVKEKIEQYEKSLITNSNLETPSKKKKKKSSIPKKFEEGKLEIINDCNNTIQDCIMTEKHDSINLDIIQNFEETNETSIILSKSPKKKSKPIEGNIQEDSPKKILYSKLDNSEGKGEILCLVEWKKRNKDGNIPDPTFVPSNVLRKTHNNMLINFYEDKLFSMYNN